MQFKFVSPADLDDWEVLGNTAWNYDSMAPYYRKLENLQGARPEQESVDLNGFMKGDVHGYGGPINASFSSSYTPIQAAWPRTMANLGLAPEWTGDLVATGLNLTANNQSFIANASREVTISGGTMKSPQMLDLPDIGDAKLHKSFGIETLIEYHPQCGVPFVPTDGELTFDDVYDEARTAFWTRIYQENGTGLLAGGVSQTAQLSYTTTAPPKASALASKHNSTSQQKTRRSEPTSAATGASAGGGEPTPGQENMGAFVGCSITYAFSREYVHIQSTDPNDDPKSDPRYLSHPLDYEVQADLQVFNARAGAIAPLSSYLKGNGTVYAPPFTEINETSVRDLIDTLFITGWHVVGSVPMMPRDQGGVLDPRLWVCGRNNVRVVDASIVPLHIRGNIISLTYAISGKEADIIKADMGAMNGTFVGPAGGPPRAFIGSAAELKAANPMALLFAALLPLPG
ncbi:MAG: hypothetical protein L6R42_005103 [Xanthoria sp. 1 TBL-2021]|nr:MAG: hypothetical protein L6R42_005103 [Xanthoria sp. 1 TBL-2021]